MPANPLTQKQLAEAAALKSLFKKWQGAQHALGHKVSQEQASASLGFGQSALSQYLNGKIPLNIDAAVKIAHLIDCHVFDFSKTLADQLAKYRAETKGVVGKKNSLAGSDRPASSRLNADILANAITDALEVEKKKKSSHRWPPSKLALLVVYLYGQLEESGKRPSVPEMDKILRLLELH